MAEIGIVGGGIAGLYCALKLIEKKHSVVVYEALDRWGGRIETRQLKGGFKAECGPMRFELDIEDHFKKLTDGLGIRFAEFTPPSSGAAQFPKYDIEQNELSAKHRKAVEGILGKGSHSEMVSGMFSQHTTALDLLKFGIYRIFHSDQQDRDLSLEDVVSGGKASKITRYADSLDDIGYNRLRTIEEMDGKPIYLLGFWNALSRVLSPGAIGKIRDAGTFYHLMPENPSASEWSIFWLRMFRSNADLSTIKDGVETIVEKLEAQLKNQAGLQLNKTVERVALGSAGKVSLHIVGDPQAHQFDHVILAIPAVPLRSLYEHFPLDIQTDVNGVIPFPLLKTFAVLKNPWWEELPLPQEGAHLVPTREVHYFPAPDDSGDRAMIMFYTDRPATSYWRPLVTRPHKRAQGMTPELKREMARHIAQLLPREGMDLEAHVQRVEDNIIDCAIRDWSEAPFGAACHAWSPKTIVPDALNRLSAFGLKGAENANNVHVCGEAYSDYQGFIEGALRSAEHVLRTI